MSKENNKRQILDGIILPLPTATVRPPIADGIILPVTTKPIVLDGFLTRPVATTTTKGLVTRPPIFDGIIIPAPTTSPIILDGFLTRPPIIFDGIILPPSTKPVPPTKLSVIFDGALTRPPVDAPASSANVYSESTTERLQLPSVASSYGESTTKYAGSDAEKVASNRPAVDANGNPIHSGIDANSASQQLASLLLVAIIVLFHVVA